MNFNKRPVCLLLCFWQQSLHVSRSRKGEDSEGFSPFLLWMVERYISWKTERIYTAPPSGVQGGPPVSVHTCSGPGAKIFILSSETGTFSSGCERRTNRLPVVADSQNLFLGTPTYLNFLRDF